MDLDIPDDAVIERVHFEPREIFDLSDPDEQDRFYQWGNRLHILTKESTLRTQILVPLTL